MSFIKTTENMLLSKWHQELEAFNFVEFIVKKVSKNPVEETVNCFVQTHGTQSEWQCKRNIYQEQYCEIIVEK